MPTRLKPRTWFEEWREPGEFYRAADENLQASFCTATRAEHGFREAWVVGAFGRIWRDERGPCKVRLLVEGASPDAQLRAEGVHLNLEVTMALPRDYKPFEEWRLLRAKPERKEDVLAKSRTSEHSREDAREAIRTAVRKKVDKHYAEPPTLLVSTGDWSLSLEEMVQVTEPWKDRFDAIYLWCGMDVVMAWPTLCVLEGKEPF